MAQAYDEIDIHQTQNDVSTYVLLQIFLGAAGGVCEKFHLRTFNSLIY